MKTLKILNFFQVKCSLIQAQEALKLQKERLAEQITKDDEKLKLEQEQ